MKDAHSSSERNTMSFRFLFGVLAATVGIFAVLVQADQPPSHRKAADVAFFPISEIKWREGPPSLPKGAMIAVLEGDPTKEGPFVFRLKLPDAYRVPPHTHPKTERVTVISGNFYLGMGDKHDERAGQAMHAGAYGHWAAGMKHFAWTKGETILQFHGTGPWTINYLNAADDPRNQGK
jgi:quercetin dioxygenase-like cupin family protein